MTGFCITCHSTFHSSGATNGSSGAFLRHPSDYLIPIDGEYGNYTEYDVTAPVARPASFFSVGMTSSDLVNQGGTAKLTWSCACPATSPMPAPTTACCASITAPWGRRQPDYRCATAEGGCLACHTTKGVLKQP